MRPDGLDIVIVIWLFVLTVLHLYDIKFEVRG